MLDPLSLLAPMHGLVQQQLMLCFETVRAKEGKALAAATAPFWRRGRSGAKYGGHERGLCKTMKQLAE